MQRQKKHHEEEGKLLEQPTLLDCPQCHSFIASDHINEDKQIAKCGHCDHVFDYKTEGYWDPFGPPLETQPEGLEVLRLQSLLELRLKHRHHVDRLGTFSTLAFSLLWNIMLLPFIFFVITSGQWYILFFISLHLFVGASLLWHVLGNLFNETTIEVSSQNLILQTTPFAGIKSRKRIIPSDQIDQLFVSRSKSNRPKTGPNLALRVRLHSGKTIELVTGLDKKTLQFLERQVEDYLGIENTQ